MDHAKGDGKKFRAAFTKINELRKETYTKLNKGLTEDQKKTLTSLQGEKFELVVPKGKFEFPKGKGKKDKDDFESE